MQSFIFTFTIRRIQNLIVKDLLSKLYYSLLSLLSNTVTHTAVHMTKQRMWEKKEWKSVSLWNVIWGNKGRINNKALQRYWELLCRLMSDLLKLLLLLFCFFKQNIHQKNKCKLLVTELTFPCSTLEYKVLVYMYFCKSTETSETFVRQ